MASTPKKARSSSVTGYLHQVSPIRKSRNNNKYFNAILQTESSFDTLVSFKSEIQKTFVEMAEARTPVLLENITTIPSLKKPGDFDWKFVSGSKVSSAKDVVQFSYSQPNTVDPKVVKIADIPSCSEYDKVSVVAKVVQISTPVRVSDTLKKMSVKLSDNTGMINMAVWNDDIEAIAINNCYNIKNITVRDHKGIRNLSSNIQSEFLKTEEIETIHVDEEDTTLETKANITAVEVTNKTLCPFCNEQVIINKDVPTVKCLKCNRKMLTETIRSHVKVEITCNNIPLNVNKDVLMAYIGDEELSNDEIEDRLLLNTTAIITDRSVTKLVPKI